jgi:hypothetical protein
MNSIIIIEFLLVGNIGIIQTLFALKTRRKIKNLATIIPELEFLKLKTYYIPIKDLQSLQPKVILKNLTTYKNKSKEQTDQLNSQTNNVFSSLLKEPNGDDKENKKEVSLINPIQKINSIVEKILLAINIYLLRNKGATNDFNFINNLVERNLLVEEENIRHTTSFPLYLGIMATIVGVVLGLLNFVYISNSNIDLGIQTFTISVSIAILASFWGLFCAFANTNINLKIGKSSLAQIKNELSVFLQTELPPELNQNDTSKIHTLHTNFEKFNENFTANLNKFSVMMNNNHNALLAQERILMALESIDIIEIANINISVLKELKTGITHLDKFNQYLNNLNDLANGTTRLTTSFENLLSHSNNFQGLAEKLNSRIEDSNKLIEFLNDHFHKLEERGEIIRESVVKVEDVMIKSLVQLEQHTQIKINAIKQITNKEVDLMTQVFTENRSHISKLSLIEDLKTSIEDFKTNSIKSIEGIKNEVKSLKKSIENSNIILNEKK